MKVYLCGREMLGSATDDDYLLIRRALEGSVEFVESPEDADVMHAVNWRALLDIPDEILRTRHVVAHVSHDVRAMLSQPDYLKIATVVSQWIGPSLRAEHMLSMIGLPAAYVPYVVDSNVFHPLSLTEKKHLRARFGLPEAAYLIGSFQRDTEGHDLVSPKLVKGPDVFLEIVRLLHRRGRNIHVLLAGPRRMWIKRQLAGAGIPFTFVGAERGSADDLTENTLDQTTINELYNIADIYVVGSRLEGGPKAVLECSASGTAVISSDVGQAPDILQPIQIFRSFPQAVSLVEADIDRAAIKNCINGGLALAATRQPDSTVVMWREIYAEISSPTTKPLTTFVDGRFRQLPPAALPLSGWRRLLSRLGAPVCFDYTPRRGPWGGGNQFLGALATVLPHHGWRVRFGRDKNCDVVLLNSFHSKLIEHGPVVGKRYVHRIDGPTALIRGKDVELDEEIFRVNERVATVTVMQSEWSLMETVRQGFHPVNPVLIHNAANPEVFRPASAHSALAGRKLRLISTSWSDNPRKGGPIYKWLDDNLDWSRYEYTFVGRISEPLRNIRVVAPVPSRQLAAILHQHDVYITASDNDPCSNALIEAMSCGLPVIHLARGGHPELVGFGGLGFERAEEIPALLDIVTEDYDAFRRLAVAPNLKETARRYADCFALALGRL